MAPTTDPGFSTAAMTAAFSPQARVAAMCRFEAALARGSAAADVLPTQVADRIARACETGFDPDAVLVDGWEAGTPVLSLLERLRTDLDDEAAAWLHHGATSQDVIDTATMLQVRDALAALTGDLTSLARDLRALAVDHRDTPTAGWTFLQPAVPTTVGRRVAGWLAPVVTHLQAIREQADILPVQLGGPSGTLDQLGDHAVAVIDAVAADLDLAVPLLPWHTDRTVVADLAGLAERIGRSMATIGTDLALLAHHGRVTMRAGGSSSMPSKRNPIDAIRAIAAAEACAGTASILTRGRPHELERGVGGWHAEWFAVPLTFQTAGAAVEATGRAVASLQVVPDDETADGPTPATQALVDRVVAACDRQVGT